MKLWDYIAAALLGFLLMAGWIPEENNPDATIAQTNSMQWIEVWVDETQTGSKS